MQSLIDERDISRQLSKFVRILDKRTWDDLSDMFAEDVRFDYAEGVEHQGLGVMRDRIVGFLQNCGPTQHLLGSAIIEVTGDTAVSRVYVQARHQGLGERQHLHFDANGKYIDEWERKETGWKIVRRVAINMISKGDPNAMGSSQTIN